MAGSKDLAMGTQGGPAGSKAPSKELVNSNLDSGVPSMEVSASEDKRSRARQLLTPEEEKKLLRRIDWHLMPLCSIIFMFKNLDSDNVSITNDMGPLELFTVYLLTWTLKVSNARIMNRGTDRNIMTELGMSSNAYALVTVFYYIPYIIGEAPSNLLIKRFSPSKWQSRILVSWGVVLGLHCLAKNSSGLYTARFFLGLFEAGQFPGVILQMCYWYRPDEMSLRLLYFYICGNLSGIFSGILAFAFDHLSGYGGLSGWQWLFLVESLATVVMGVIVWYTLPDFPDTASWLSEKEKAFIQARLPPNAPRASEQTFKFSEIVASLKDVRLWLFTLIWAFFTVGTSGTTNINIHSDLATAQILNIPITVLGLLLIAGTGLHADNARLPRPLRLPPSNAAIYAATMLGNAVTAAWYPMMWPWRVQTTSRATGSAFAIGFVNSYGQIGSAVGPQLFRDTYAPRYRVSFGVAMALVGACMGVTLGTWYLTRRTERETRRLKREKLAAARRGESFVEELSDEVPKS
ncbi:transporter [Apiospora rasikravindrae]|uniref:Transporter n=1 Tax=Apiospora rasikravindrae TaxID=990691 RepID=A0ABR1U071_9PEZI